jgi:G3E family GTPase
MKPFLDRIPLVLLTGFLGSGKTTLLRELLLHPQMEDTAVLINELGAVGLDHHLVWGSNDATLVLENGCICCSVRDDFVSTLQDLFWKRLHREIPRFKRVVIETTGVADPLPVVNLLLSDPLLAERYRLDTVITTVDALLGQGQLDQHWETVKQITAADTLLITKVDLADETNVTELEQRLEELNPLAVRLRVTRGQVTPELLFNARSASDRSHKTRSANWQFRAVAKDANAPTLETRRSKRALHDSRIQNFALHINGPVESAQIVASLSDVLKQFGSRLLRIKGLADIVDEGRPVIVQAVGDILFPLETLDAWPPDQRGTNLVFITVELGAQAVLDALDKHLPGRISLIV